MGAGAVWTGFLTSVAAVAVAIRLARYACGHHLSRAAESQRRYAAATTDPKEQGFMKAI